MTKHVNIPFDELCSLYAKAALLVVPSRYEAFSYVALEALSYGTPVLLSDRVRIADYLENVEGVSVFTYHDYKDFVEKVKKSTDLVVNDCEVKRLFSGENIKEKYMSLFMSLARK